MKLTPEAIRRRERAFEKMSPAEKRVAVAKDVIAALRCGMFTAGSTYYSGGASWDPYCDDVDPKQQIRDRIVADPDCRVCGVGSVFVAAVLRHDDLTVEDVNSLDSRDDMVAYLKGLFSEDQLNMIESAFERGAVDWKPQYRRAERFGDVIFGPTERLIAIMKNIIANEGTFKP